MKVINGVNPDYADFDELDDSVAEAFDEFDAGVLSFEELKIQVGQDAAQAFAESREGDEFSSMFDNPEYI
jgi:hypothetical protein